MLEDLQCVRGGMRLAGGKLGLIATPMGICLLHFVENCRRQRDPSFSTRPFPETAASLFLFGGLAEQTGELLEMCFVVQAARPKPNHNATQASPAWKFVLPNSIVYHDLHLEESQGHRISALCGLVSRPETATTSD